MSKNYFEDDYMADDEEFMDKEDIEDFYLNDDEDLFVTITLEDDSEVECQVLTIFEVEGQDYIVLLPLDDENEDSEEAEVYIYRYFEDEDGEPGLDNLESDEEFEMVSEIFDQIVEDEEDDDDIY